MILFSLLLILTIQTIQVSTCKVGVGWDKMARIYYDSNQELTNADLATTVTITIGTNTVTHRWRCDDSYCSSSWGWSTSTTAHNINLTISLLQYLDLNNNNYTISVGSSSSSVATCGSDWNDPSPRCYTTSSNKTSNYGSFGKGDSQQQIGIPIQQYPAFSSQLFNAFNSALGGKLASMSYGSQGSTYLKFGIGSGSSRANGTRINGNSSFPRYMFDGYNNLDSILIRDPGYIEEDDDPDRRKGYYHPLLFPRVTVFVLRKSVTRIATTLYESVNWHPTNIECVGSISKLGVVEQLHLLSVPNNCVFDTSINQYTPLMPQPLDSNPDRHVNSAGTSMSVVYSNSLVANSYGDLVSYQDLGFMCKIDPSHQSTDVTFGINNNGLSMITNTTHNFQSSWSSHISTGFGDSLNRDLKLRTNSHVYACGIIPDGSVVDGNNSKSLTIDNIDINGEIDASRPAELSLQIERISLSGYRKTSISNSTTGTSLSNILTGRLSALTINDVGEFNPPNNINVNNQRCKHKIFNQTFMVKSIKPQRNLSYNLGYKPNSVFYLNGLPGSKASQYSASPTTVDICEYFCVKAKVEVDAEGKISNFNIIDRGYGFSGSNDFVLFPYTPANNHPSRGLPLQVYNGHIDSLSAVLGGNIIFNNLLNFPKSDLIFQVDADHFNDIGRVGSISKFYIKQRGKGFAYSQFIDNIFSANSYTPPTFNVVISNGSLQSISIDSSNPGVGYSVSDDVVTARFSKAPPVSSSPIENVNLDDYARYRSIYLNDVPIRDKNGRFNYSKFHFDMRIGNYQNGYLEKNEDIHDSLPEDGSDLPLISSEFRLPSHSKMIGFPLYGPRNNGEKDYFYTHTVKNPEVNAVTISIQINELNYIYEGDESAIFINLLPLIAMAAGMAVGEHLGAALANALIPDPVAGTVTTSVTGSVSACTAVSGTGTGTFAGVTTGFGLDDLMQAAAKSIITLAASLVGGFVFAQIAKNLIKCSDVPFLCFKVGELIKNSGEVWPAKVNFRIEYGVEGEELLNQDIVFNGCATSPYVKDILLESLPSATGYGNNFKNRIIRAYRTTRETDPVRGGIVESRYNISAELHSVTEHVAGYFSFPNTAIIGTRVNSKDFSSVPKREYLIKGRLINVPNNYNPIINSYSGNWGGQFKTEWTSNPAWVIYDLLINSRYGMGKYGITENEIDIWSFYTFAKFCDETIDTVIDGVYESGTTAYKERRHMCNLYVDSEREAYEYIKDLLKVYHSTINFSGGKIYITTDSPSDPIMLFNNANISESGFSYSSTPETHRLTSVSVDYLDERDNYILKTEYVEDGIGVAEHGYSHAKIAGTGITRRGEAHRLCWKTILNRQIEKEIISFSAGLQASYLRIGDVINIMDNSKISKHSGGRILNILDYSRNSQYNYIVQIDIPASLIVGSNSTILVETSAFTEDDRPKQYASMTVVGGSNFTLSLRSNTYVDIKPGSIWMIENDSSTNIKPKPYRIKSIAEKDNMNFEIVAIEYISEKYDAIDKSSGFDGAILEDREYSGHEIIIP